MNKQKVLAWLGVIVLGAIGSGFWELAKPLLGWAWEGLLTVANLGLDSLRDGMYEQAGGSATRATVVTVAQLICGLLLNASALVALYVKRASVVRPIRPFSLIPAFFAAMSIAVLVTAIRSSYIAQVAAYRERLETLAAPHVSDGELKVIRADFLRVKGRAEFLSLVDRVKKPIIDAGMQVPERSFF